MNFIFGILADFWGTLSEMAPYLLFGFLVAGLLSVWISPKVVERHLGGRGFMSILKASLFGVPLAAVFVRGDSGGDVAAQTRGEQRRDNFVFAFDTADGGRQYSGDVQPDGANTGDCSSFGGAGDRIVRRLLWWNWLKRTIIQRTNANPATRTVVR